jgi:hypothetical protein
MHIALEATSLVGRIKRDGECIPVLAVQPPDTPQQLRVRVDQLLLWYTLR